MYSIMLRQSSTFQSGSLQYFKYYPPGSIRSYYNIGYSPYAVIYISDCSV